MSSNHVGLGTFNSEIYSNLCYKGFCFEFNSLSLSLWWLDILMKLNNTKFDGKYLQIKSENTQETIKAKFLLNQHLNRLYLIYIEM